MLILISKVIGDPQLQLSYRLLCMLDTVGKVYEKLIKVRLWIAIREAGDLSPTAVWF